MKNDTIFKLLGRKYHPKLHSNYGTSVECQNIFNHPKNQLNDNGFFLFLYDFKSCLSLHSNNLMLLQTSGLSLKVATLESF